MRKCSTQSLVLEVQMRDITTHIILYPQGTSLPCRVLMSRCLIFNTPDIEMKFACIIFCVSGSCF